MEVFLYIFAAFISLFLIFLLIEKPYYVVSIYVFMVLYQFNVETPLPLDARGIILLILFMRLYFFDKENLTKVNMKLLTNSYFWIFMFFILAVLFEPLASSKSLIRYSKDIVLAIIGIILGFLLAQKEEGRKALIFGIILSALFSSFDLVFTFSTTGSLQIIKLVTLILGRGTELINHNYPGFISSLGLFSIFMLWNQADYKKSILLVISLFLSLGIVISTSRSAILALVIVFILITIIEPDYRHHVKRIVPIGSSILFSLVAFFFVYNIFFTNAHEESYIDKIYYRLYEEPLQILTGEKADFDKYSGQRIKGSMTFRAERWAEDFDKFLKLDLTDQLIGLGPKGYLEIADKVYHKSGHLRYKLSPHNGYLIILLERGLIGILLFFILLTLLVTNTIRYRGMFLPSLYLFLMIAIYAIGQNSELTSPYTYLILGSVIGNIIYTTNLTIEEEEDGYGSNEEISLNTTQIN